MPPRPGRQRGWVRSPATTRTVSRCSTSCACTATRWPTSTRSWCRPNLLSAAQEAWDLAVELGEQYGVRNSQASRAGPDRHHRPAHGLRHHRHRARPRAGQDQEAGRRRHHVDRQPDGPAGPRAGSATRPTRSSEIVAYIDEHKTIVGAPHLAPSTSGLRLLDGRQHHPLPGPRPDDGRRSSRSSPGPSPRRSTCPRT